MNGRIRSGRTDTTRPGVALSVHRDQRERKDARDDERIGACHRRILENRERAAVVGGIGPNAGLNNCSDPACGPMW